MDPGELTPALDPPDGRAPAVADGAPDTRALPPAVPLPGRGRDRLLDVVRAIAIARVVLWHTWSSWWLTWFPAMPAMFFTTGALLDDSLERRGWTATVRQRGRRLLLPFWAYGAACWVAMLAVGWRPDAGDVLGWIVPVADPVGSPELSALWIPLWYVRAYVWFVLCSGVLRRLLGLLGPALVPAVGVVTVALWLAEDRLGRAVVPNEVGDFLAYAVFVLAGMWYRSAGAPRRRTCLTVGLALAAVAVAWTWRFGPSDLVVNRSYPLTLLVGGAGVGLLLWARPWFQRVGGLPGRWVDLVGRRTLSIYLWHGFGLLAAERLVGTRLDDGPWSDVVALAVVVVVTAGAVVIFGPIEDLAAGRPSPRRRRATVAATPPTPPTSPTPPTLPMPPTSPTPPASPTPPTRWPLRIGAVVLAVVLVGMSMRLGPGDADATAAPLSGPAVVARAGLLDEQPATSTTVAGAARLTPTQVVEAWLAAHPELDAVGFDSLRGAWVSPDGVAWELSWRRGGSVSAEVVPDGSARPAGAPEARPGAWWSITKMATATWLLRTVEAGQVRLDQTIDAWLPEVPHADEITLEQLARHRSGIPEELDTRAIDATPIDAVRRFEESGELAFEPGTGFSYSRTGYVLLALALERATGTPWRAAMEDMGALAGVTLSFDDDVEPLPEVTDPDRHGYHGRLWSSGAIMSSPADLARFARWALTVGVSPASREAMMDFSAELGDWVYGIGLMPLCPCDRDGDAVRSGRAGLDSLASSVAVDPATEASVALWPNAWFADGQPVPAFYELEGRLLDALAP